MVSLLHTLLELGHNTSQNLGFAQATHGQITYSEETITETNLLELKRRHPNEVHIHSFTKAQESRTSGADWEWHIIGSVGTLKMRVQAKRVYIDGGLHGFSQRGKFAKVSQIDLLVKNAAVSGLLPIYCFYCSEIQREHWKISKTSPLNNQLETGCLIVDAKLISHISPKKLQDIESKCVPWHFLCSKNQFSMEKGVKFQKFQEKLDQISGKNAEVVEYWQAYLPESDEISNFVDFSQLNSKKFKPNSASGLHLTKENPFVLKAKDDDAERDVSFIVQVDVRGADFFHYLIDRKLG